jgi:hypothetical protein
MSTWAILALVVVFLVMLRIPAALAILQTFVTLLIAPASIMLRRRQLLPTPYQLVTPEQLAAWPGVPAAMRTKLADWSRQCQDLGFDDGGTWISCVPQGAVQLSAVVVHPATHTVGVITGIAERNAIHVISLSLMTRRGETVMATSCADWPTPLAGLIELPERWFMPSLRSPALLWEAHQARLARETRPAAPPQDPALPWGTLLDAERAAFIAHYTAAGLMRPPRPPKAGRWTLRGAFALIRPGLWPWKQASSRRLLAAEKQRLTELDRTDLLDRATRELPSATEPPRLTSQLEGHYADDRGTMRRVKPPALPPTDDRARDRRLWLLQRWATESLTPHQGMVGPIVGLGVFGIFAIALIPGEFWPLRIIAGLLVVGLLITIARARGINAPGIAPVEVARARLLARGVCPCCLYSLAGLKPEPDGCTTCPECGSGWRADRIIECIRYGDSAAADEVRSTQRRLTRISLAIPGRPRQPAWRDDRGTRCVLTDPSLIVELTIGDLPGPTSPMATAIHQAATALSYRNAVAEAEAHEQKPRSRPARLLRRYSIEAALLAAVALDVMWVTIWHPQADAITAALILAGIAALALVTSPLWRRWLHLPKPAQIRRILLRHKLCPVCTTPLGHKPPQADGCTVCSCGAAWKLEPSASAQPV